MTVQRGSAKTDEADEWPAGWRRCQRGSFEADELFKAERDELDRRNKAQFDAFWRIAALSGERLRVARQCADDFGGTFVRAYDLGLCPESGRRRSCGGSGGVVEWMFPGAQRMGARTCIECLWHSFSIEEATTVDPRDRDAFAAWRAAI